MALTYRVITSGQTLDGKHILLEETPKNKFHYQVSIWEKEDDMLDNKPWALSPFMTLEEAKIAYQNAARSL